MHVWGATDRSRCSNVAAPCLQAAECTRLHRVTLVNGTKISSRKRRKR